MTELQKLQHIIDDGFQPMMILREISQNEVTNKLPEVYWDKKVYALPLVKFNEDKKLMFYMVEEETINYANQLVEDAKTIIGYSPVVYCTVLSEESAKGQKINFESIIDSLSSVTGWKIKKSEYPNTIEIRNNIKSGDKESLNMFIRDVETVVMLVSLKNQKGLQVSACSPGEYTKGQPFGITWGLQQFGLKGITTDELISFNEILNNDLCREAVSSLQLIYSQISDSSKLTICWATIEHIFNKKPEHLLQNGEILSIQDAVQSIGLEKDKSNKVMEIIKNPNLVCAKNRNVRIAEEISESIGFDYAYVYDEIRNMTRSRGKMVHALGNETDITQHLIFIEKTLSSYIKKHSGIDL